MKKYLFKTTLILLPVLVTAIVCECIMRLPDNDYRHKSQWLEVNSDKIQVWNLGSSHAYFGIDPTIFEMVEFNGAHISQDIHYDYFIFNKYFNKMKGLEYLILPVSYMTPYANIDKGVESWRVKNYCIYYHCPFHLFNPKYNLEIYNGLNLRGLGIIRNKREIRYCTELGQGTQYKLESRNPSWKETGKIAAERHSNNGKNDRLYRQNKRRVNKIIEKCRENGVKVIILSTPTFETYRNNLNPEQLKNTIAFCEELRKENSNVVYLNMLNDSRFEEDDYFDADHLNEYGARKLSKILNDYIMQDRSNN